MPGKILVLHDLEASCAELVFGEYNFTLFSALPEVRACIGCFGCWVKTPGRCVIKDRGAQFTELLRTHDELIIVSRLVFGGYSPLVKAVLDRSIGYLLPFFRTESGDSVHLKRTKGDLSVTAVFYGSGDGQEKALAERLTKANGKNLRAKSSQSIFFPTPEEIKLP
jgi:multimeric flavodoxin WrbA